MSDPVTNVEIEDVLSSIRRLVAEGDKAKKREKSRAEAPKAQPERLVLTPAFRVADDASDSQPVEEPASQYAPQAEEISVAQVVAELAADDEDVPLEIITAQDEPAPALDIDVPFDRERLEQGDVPFDRASLEATIAELEAAVTDQPDDWEPDGSETDLDPTWASAGFASDQPVEDAIEITDDAAVDTDMQDSDAKEAAAWDAAEVLEASVDPVTPPKAAPVTSEPVYTPRASAAADPTPASTVPPLSFQRHAPQDSDEDYGDDLRTDAGDDNPDPELAAYLADDATIDEAMLRQLVMEIVREELQGKLGERITRNVRKLVRREIHRVLTSQDFD